MHRDTLRKFDQCSDKLQHGTCARNKVRFLKNDPNLTCPHCTVQLVRYTAPLPSGNLAYDNEVHSTAVAGDNSDPEISWAEDNAIQQFPTSLLRLPSSVLSCSLPASTQFDFQLPSHSYPDDGDLEELSHEDGIQLIDEMYGAEQPKYGIDDMDTSDNEMYYVPVETHYNLEQAHEMINKTNKPMQRSHKGGSADASSPLLQKYGATPIEINDTNKKGIKADIFEARELLYRAQQELDKLRHTRQEIESEFLWCLEKYITPTQISIESIL